MSITSPPKSRPNADLSQLNTMQLTCIADRLITSTDESQIESIVMDCKTHHQPLFILSGGSNVILPSRIHAYVLRPDMRGINIIAENDEHITIEVMAGEPWHDLVTKTVTNGWYGLENLALIPGLTGAAPVQNIGAYGVQIEDTLAYVRAYHLPTATWHSLTNEQCAFDYRDSKFKRQAKEWLITRVAFNLHKNVDQVSINYGDVATLATALAKKDNRHKAYPVDIMRAIIQIRQSKLPDPKVLPNCGSFFKNPIIKTAQFLNLQQVYPDIVGYKLDDDYTKVAAGWLIDKAGLKGGGIAPILTHTHQALVLVNHTSLEVKQGATQEDIETTQQLIQQRIEDMFHITLQREPVWVDTFANYI